MKLCRYRRGDGARVGIVEGDDVYDAGDSLFDLDRGEHVGPWDAVPLLAPVLRPSKIVGIGLNYRDHAAETGAALPEQPLLFAMWANAVVGPGEPIRLPPAGVSTFVDYEAELGVVIGTRASGVAATRALDHVLGYTCLNDVSARDRQRREPQWIRGKSLDTFCPIGPWITTADELPDPQALAIKLHLNGETMQDSSTAEMVFGVAELIAFVSEAITLEPGDVIATGTPPGVGASRRPPVSLKAGDTVVVEIEGIGLLTNPVV